MQLSQNVQSFFHHVTTEFAISKGWDFEQDLTEFYKDKDLDLSDIYLSCTNADQTMYCLTENDVFEASCGVATPEFAEFWNTLTIVEDAPDDGVMLQSMHSGSSDYLYVKDVREMQKLFKNAVA